MRDMFRGFSVVFMNVSIFVYVMSFSKWLSFSNTLFIRVWGLFIEISLDCRVVCLWFFAFFSFLFFFFFVDVVVLKQAYVLVFWLIMIKLSFLYLCSVLHCDVSCHSILQPIRLIIFFCCRFYSFLWLLVPLYFSCRFCVIVVYPFCWHFLLLLWFVLLLLFQIFPHFLFLYAFLVFGVTHLWLSFV